MRAVSCLITNDCLNVEEEEEIFTTGRDVGEALVLASFPLAVADVEVHVDRSGESLVPIGRDLYEERALQQKEKKVHEVTSSGLVGNVGMHQVEEKALTYIKTVENKQNRKTARAS